MSKREKHLILILLVVAGTYLFYQFLLNPKLQEYSRVKEEKDTILMEIKKVKRAAGQVKSKEEKIEQLKKELDDISLSMFDSYEEEHIGMVLEDIIQKHVVTVDDIAISPPDMVKISFLDWEEQERPQTTLEKDYEAFLGEHKSVIEDESQDKDVKEKENEITTKSMKITLNLTGQYKEIMGFVYDIETYNKKFLIKDITIGKNDEFSYYRCALDLEVYTLPGEMKFDRSRFKKEGRRDNPFSSTWSDDSSLSFIRSNPDFYIQLRPTSSDINTMIMGLYNGGAGIITLDRKTVIEGFIHVKEQEGKILFRYGLEEENYPQGEESFVEIALNEEGKIFLDVESNRRNQGDENGVKLRIINETSKEFIYRVLGDDKMNPRFKAIVEKGKVREE